MVELSTDEINDKTQVERVLDGILKRTFCESFVGIEDSGTISVLLINKENGSVVPWNEKDVIGVYDSMLEMMGDSNTLISVFKEIAISLEKSAIDIEQQPYFKDRWMKVV